jgi:hypothetical protein
MTSADWSVQENYDQLYSNNYEDALHLFKKNCSDIRQGFEFLIDEDSETIRVKDLKVVNKGVKALKALSIYTFEAIDGEDDHEVDIDYDFTDQVKEELVELGVQ